MTYDREGFSYIAPITCFLRNMHIKHSTDMNHTIFFGRHSKESSCFQTRYSQDAETTIHILHCRQTISRLKQTIASLKIKHSIDMNITILYANFSAWSTAVQTMDSQEAESTIHIPKFRQTDAGLMTAIASLETMH